MGRLRGGLIATARIILLGIAMDVIYQFLVFETFYPAQALLIALLLAFIPYLLIRGPVTLIAHGGAVVHRAKPGEGADTHHVHGGAGRRSAAS